MTDNMKNRKIDERIERELAGAGIEAKIESHDDLIKRYRQQIEVAKAMIVLIWSNYGPPCETTDTDPGIEQALNADGRCPVCAAHEVAAWLVDYATMWEEELAFEDPSEDMLALVRRVVEQPITQPEHVCSIDLPSITDIQAGFGSYTDDKE